MQSVAITTTVIILLQTIFSLYQIRYYNRFIVKLTKKYSTRNGYRLRIETEKKLISSIVVIIVTDNKNMIVESYFYKGLTILSKFKEYLFLINKTIDNELIHQLKQEKSKIKRNAFEKLIRKEMETITI